MKIRFRYIALISVLSMLMHSCIEYDMSYPRQLAEFSTFEVENALSVDIDPSTMTVNVTLNEAADMSVVHVTKVELKDNAVFKGGSFPEILDLSGAPYSVILSNTHDYRWTVKAVQPVERYIKCQNQVGEASFNIAEQEAYVYVSNSQRLKYLSFTDVKFELEGAVVESTTGLSILDGKVTEHTQNCSFPYPADEPVILDCTDRRTFKVLSRGKEYVWGLTVIPVEVPAQIVSVASWCWSADIQATFDGTSQPPVIQYKKVSDQEWIPVSEENIVVDGVNCHYHLADLEQGTDYEVKFIFAGEELPGVAFTTDTPQQLYNFDFDNWWSPDNGGLWYPYEQGTSAPTWDSANSGTAGFGLGSSTVPEDRNGGKSVKMSSKYVVVKFAAGTLFTGKYNKTVGTVGADLDWGVPFTAKPKALKGKYKYQPALVNYEENKMVTTDRYDQGQIQVILIQTETPYRVLPVSVAGGKTLNGPTYKDETKLIDLESHETIIARGSMIFGITDSDNDGQADWVEFELPLEYRDFRTPTYVIVTAASSYLGDYFTGGDGSVLCVDEFEFIYE